MTRLLLLGGTTEASRLAALLARARIPAVFSYAGRTGAPKPQPLPTRIGGFGGAAGLAAFLKTENITHVIDATHPFAAQISRNAMAACAQTSLPLLTIERPAWQPGAGDLWTCVPDLPAAIAALPQAKTRVFLAIGKQNLAPFAARDHHYLLRLVDPPKTPLPLPDCTVITARGPFDIAGDTALMRAHAITHLIAKNAGGEGASAKLSAARDLGIQVIMIDRPALRARQIAASPDEAMTWLADHGAVRGV